MSQSFELKIDDVDLELNQIFREAAVEFVVTYSTESAVAGAVVLETKTANRFNSLATQRLASLTREHDIAGTFKEGPARDAFKAGAQFALKLHGGVPWE